MKINDNTSYIRIPERALDQRPSFQDLISDEESTIIRVINTVIINTLIGLFGIIANAINMIVFYRQGFKTSTNISFFTIALSDMLCLVTSQWFDIALNPYLDKSEMQFIPVEVMHLTGGWFHVCASRITSWITVFITAERCVGIALPLKVKQFFTPRRTTIGICIIWVANISTLIPEYAIAYLDWKFVPARNRTLFGLLYRSNKDQGYGLVFLLTSASGTISFVCVILLTMFLVTRLSQKSKWRKIAIGGSDNSDTISSRDKKTVKMITIIAIVLIVCYIPGIALSLVSPFVPEFTLGRAFSKLYLACWSICFVFETINSSVNVFLYYRMSTKYRQSFNELFSRCISTDTRSSATPASR